MRIILLNSAVFFISFMAIAQTGLPLKTVELSDANKGKQKIPYIGSKVVVVYYIDPDVHKANAPIFDAVKAKNYDKRNFDQVIVINCKDTWYPTAAIRSGVKSQVKAGHPVTLLDENKLVPDSWGFKDCDDACYIIVIGADSKIKFIKSVRSEAEGKAAVQYVLKAVNNELGN